MRSTLITYLVDFVVLFLCMMMHVHIHPTSVARANSTPIMAPSSVTVLLSGDVIVGWIILATNSVPPGRLRVVVEFGLV